MYTRKFIDGISGRDKMILSCMNTVCRNRVMLARIMHSELLVARMYAELDASELPFPESSGFVVVVTVC